MTGADLSPSARAAYDRCLRIVRLASVIVPERRREEWAREWDGELWYRASLLDGPHTDRRSSRGLLLRTLGAFPHALWAFTDEMRLDPMLQDLKYAIRGIVKRPAFAALSSMHWNPSASSVSESVARSPA